MLHITAGAAPQGGLSLASDIKLVKAALLYADHVTLVSPGAYLIHTIASARSLDDAATFASFLPAMAQLEPSLAAREEELAAAVMLLTASRSQRRQLPPKARKEMEVHIKNVRAILYRLRETITGIASQSGLAELERAVASGLVSLHEFTPPSDGLDRTIEEFTTELLNVVEEGSRFPLFDEQVNSLVRSAINEGMVSSGVSAVDRGKQAQLAGYLFDRLPLFEQVSVDEILDIRSSLERPLLRFRAAVVEFSNTVRSAGWDINFAHDAEMVFVQRVQPAVLDIEDAIRAGNFLGKLTDRITADQVASGSLVAVLTNHVAASAAIAAAAGAAMTGGLAVLRALRDYRQNAEQIQQNHLFFYYAVGKRLGK